MNFDLTLLCIVLVTALGIFTPRAAKGDHLDDVVTAEMGQRHIPGLALVVIANGEVVREQGYGYCDANSAGR